MVVIQSVALFSKTCQCAKKPLSSQTTDNKYVVQRFRSVTVVQFLVSFLFFFSDVFHMQNMNISWISLGPATTDCSGQSLDIGCDGSCRLLLWLTNIVVNPCVWCSDQIQTFTHSHSATQKKSPGFDLADKVLSVSFIHICVNCCFGENQYFPQME